MTAPLRADAGAERATPSWPDLRRYIGPERWQLLSAKDRAELVAIQAEIDACVTRIRASHWWQP